MIKFRSISPLARKGLLSLALVAPIAFAGHLNKLVTADLDGRQEFDPLATSKAIVGDPDGRGEFYAFSIDNTATNPITVNSDVLCYNLQVKRIGELDMAPGNGRQAHIHKGKPGANGGVVANLAWPQGGQAADCLNAVTQTTRFGMTATIDTARAVIADILANPEEYYVNVHNAEYPAGAIRGQVRVATF